MINDKNDEIAQQSAKLDSAIREIKATETKRKDMEIETW